MTAAVTILSGNNQFANGVNQLKSAVNTTANNKSYGTCTKKTTRGTIIVPISRFRNLVADDVDTGTTAETSVWF